MRRSYSFKARSGYEAKIMEDLNQRKIPYQYETLKLSYVKEVCPHCEKLIKKGTYTPDFILGDVIIESKGRFDIESRKKMLQVKASNPSLDIRLLFQYDNKLTKVSKKRYSDWARSNGFIFAIGMIPEEWVV